MDFIWESITEWLKEVLVGGIMDHLSGMFDAVNQQVGDVATQVGTSPANFSPGVFSMIRNVSESVIIPIAGIILTIIACYELIQMIIDHNNLANFETWIFFKWVFKTFVAVMLITNCFNITMAVFDVCQNVINGAEYPKATHHSMWQKKNGIFHPTVKNEVCLQWLIQISSNPGDLVFDGFMGTGSTALAAIQSGRKFTGTEISEEYWKIAQERIRENRKGVRSDEE